MESTPVELVGEGFFTFDLHRRTIALGPSLARLVGFPPKGEQSEAEWLARMHPDDRDGWHRLPGLTPAASPRRASLRLAMPGADWLEGQLVCETTVDEQGRPERIVGRWIPLGDNQLPTPQSSWQQWLTPHNWLLTVMDHMPTGVWITDAEGTIIYGNPEGQRIWAGAEYVPPERYGVYKGWRVATGELLQPGDWALRRAISSGESVLNEVLEIEAFDGTRRYILNSAMPIRHAAGGLSGAVVINQDITAQFCAERELGE